MFNKILFTLVAGALLLSSNHALAQEGFLGRYTVRAVAGPRVCESKNSKLLSGKLVIRTISKQPNILRLYVQARLANRPRLRLTFNIPNDPYALRAGTLQPTREDSKSYELRLFPLDTLSPSEARRFRFAIGEAILANGTLCVHFWRGQAQRQEANR